MPKEIQLSKALAKVAPPIAIGSKLEFVYLLKISQRVVTKGWSLGKCNAG